MLVTADNVRAFHCPRYAELPGIPLYMDQVILVLDGSLSLFAEEDGHVVTPTMINNYVKQKVISSPDGKRYGKEQLAMLVVLCLLKKVLSIGEITGFIGLVTENTTIDNAYDMFCTELEASLIRTFTGESVQTECSALPDVAVRAGSAALTALTEKLFAQGLISQWCRLNEKPEARKTSKKKTDGKK